MKDSFVFYRSFYEAIHKVNDKELKADIFEAICELALNENTIELTDSLGSIIMELIKPQIEANNKRYTDGKKGGRPKKKETKKTTGSEKEKTTGYENKKPNVNENENVNVNDNDNNKKKTSKKEKLDVVVFYEENIGTLSPTIYEELLKLEKQYSGEIVIEAIRRAILQNKRSMNYIKGILKNWGNRTLEEILNEDNKKSNVPSWFNQEIIDDDKWEISDEDKKRFGIT